MEINIGETVAGIDPRMCGEIRFGNEADRSQRDKRPGHFVHELFLFRKNALAVAFARNGRF
jgi:hypothetical protein